MSHDKALYKCADTLLYDFSVLVLEGKLASAVLRLEGMSLVLVTMVFLLDIGRLSPFGSHLKKEFKKES